jgi:uncharacterized protein (DUF58 family)
MIPKELLLALRTIEFVTAKLATDQLSGSYASGFRGQGLAFREVRPYQAGDPIRSIDWNVSARMNAPYVKLFTEEREITVMLAVDLSASEQFGTRRANKVRLASEVAALVSFSAQQNRDRVGLVIATDRVERVVPPKGGQHHAMRVVREILGFEPQYRHPSSSGSPKLGQGTNLNELLTTLMRVSKRRSIAFLISDFFDTGFERTLGRAAAKHDLIPIVLTDPRDKELADVGLVAFEDLESGASITVDTSDARVRAHYAHSMKHLANERRSMFTRLGLDAVEIETAGSFVSPLRDLFMRRARRR